MAMEQAPKILREGRPQLDVKPPFGNLMVDNRIFYAVYKATGKSKADLGIMMLLLGCAQDGSFSLPFQTVKDRLGIASTSTYYDALNRLNKEGLIEWEKGDYIAIKMDTLWSLALNSDKPENSEMAESDRQSDKSESCNTIPGNRNKNSGQPESQSPVYTQYNNIREQDKKQDNISDSGLSESDLHSGLSEYPTISREVVEQIFVNPEYLEGDLIRNGDKIFRLEN